MNKVEELVQKYCPDGVECKQIEKVCRIEKGKQLNKDNLLAEGEYPVYNGGINPSGYWSEANFDASRIAISQGGANAGYVNFVKTKFWAGAHCYVLEPIGCDIDYRFLYHCMKNSQVALMESKEGAGIPGLSKKKLAALEIPIPPIEVQQEIVRILDAMCELEAKLQEELEARIEQFATARKRMIQESDGKVCVVGDFCDISRGKVISKQYLADHPGIYPVYSSQTANNGVFGLIDTFAYSGEYVTWTTDGANAGTVFYRNGNFSITNVCGLLKADEKVSNSKYLAHVLSLVAKGYVSEGMGNPKLMSNVMAKIPISLPPIETQREIVAKLDAFEALIQNLKEEIDARHSQYEHYRDTLLSFEKKGA